LKVLKRLGYLKFVRPGILEICDNKLWEWLVNSKKATWQPIPLIKNHER